MLPTLSIWFIWWWWCAVVRIDEVCFLSNCLCALFSLVIIFDMANFFYYTKQFLIGWDLIISQGNFNMTTGTAVLSTIDNQDGNQSSSCVLKFRTRKLNSSREVILTKLTLVQRFSFPITHAAVSVQMNIRLNYNLY